MSTSAITFPWIINKKTDLIWFIGGALSGYFLFFLNVGLGWDMISIWFIWVTFIDTPHFFGTYSRTFFDKEEFANRKKLLLGSMLWYLAGPLAVLISYLMYSVGSVNYYVPWSLFAAFFGAWAYWQVVRQHYGFMALYKKKMGEKSSFDFKLDSAMLYGGLLLPFLVFVSRHPDTRGFVFIVDASSPLIPIISIGTTILVIGVSLIFIARQVYLSKLGEKINGAKILFLLAVVPLHFFICYSDAVLDSGFFAFGAFVTVFHDLQYHAIVWFHHKNRYHKKGVDSTRFGIAAKISKNLAVFICCAVFMGVLVRLLGCSIQVHPGCFPFYIATEKMIFADFGMDKLLQGVLIGFALQHYFLDQFIWRTSKDKTLNKDLKLSEPAK